MTRGEIGLILAVAALALFALMAWGWRRRSRRDAGLVAPVGDLPAGSAVRGVFPGLYVATTVHDVPLERRAIAGLAFRSRVTVTVADTGIALDLPGQSRIVIVADRIADVAQATVAIDRVVERDGLVRVDWRITDDTLVDTYLRPQDVSARALADAIRPLIHRSRTGSAA